MRFLTEDMTPNRFRRAITRASRILQAKWSSIFGSDLTRIGGASFKVWHQGGPCGTVWPLRPGIETDRLIGRLLAGARKAEAREFSIRYLPPSCPADLPTRLAQRGFKLMEPKNSWMLIDGRHTQPVPILPPEISIELLDTLPPVEGDDLPFHTDHLNAFFDKYGGSRPRTSVYLAAFDTLGHVGHATLQLFPGELGIGMMEDVGVRPRGRGQGIGTAIASAVVQEAIRAGCRHIVTHANKAGEPVYGRIGFEIAATPQIWTIQRELLHTPWRFRP